MQLERTWRTCRLIPWCWLGDLAMQHSVVRMSTLVSMVAFLSQITRAGFHRIHFLIFIRNMVSGILQQKGVSSRTVAGLPAQVGAAHCTGPDLHLAKTEEMWQMFAGLLL